MKANQLKSYRFATTAQWNACVFAQTDRAMLQQHAAVQPCAAYVQTGALYASQGAHAPVVTRAQEILWRDDECQLQRLTTCDDAPESCAAPRALARAARLVSTSQSLWVLGAVPNTLERYEAETWTRLLTVALPDKRVTDLAAAEKDSIWALVESAGVWQAVRVDQRGQRGETVAFKGLSHVTAFVYLRHKRRFVVLTSGSQARLYWFAATGGAALFSLAVAGLHPCFEAHALGSDGREKVLLAGADSPDFGGGAYVLIFDAEGDRLGEVPLEARAAPVTGVVATRHSVLVTGPRGLVRFEPTETVPLGAPHTQCRLLTPVLFSPDREDQRRWLRIEARAHLPEGCTLEIAYAATEDIAEQARLQTLVSNESLPARQRIERLLGEPGLQLGRTEFQGHAQAAAQPAQTYATKLFDVRKRYLWVCLTLTATPGAQLPSLTELNVLYPGHTLLENLPAIYQREEVQPDSFLRALIGVLETTTQELDARIGSLGRYVNPATAPEPWLDFVARWLGLPWDDALTLSQKQALVSRAAMLAQGRGTRAGLEALLDCLLPSVPRRFRVLDATADYGFAVVGGAACIGSALPALLGGRTRWSPTLNESAVLGRSRLPCTGQVEDGVWQLAGKVRVAIAATVDERKAMEPWLLALLTEMIPLTARLELRWVAAQSLRGTRLDGTLTLAAAPTPHLGTDAITNLARLPAREIRLADAGTPLGLRLR